MNDCPECGKEDAGLTHLDPASNASMRVWNCVVQPPPVWVRPGHPDHEAYLAYRKERREAVRKAKRQSLGEELADLERTDPTVKAAADRYDEMVQKVTSGRSHAIPCTIKDCEWHT